MHHLARSISHASLWVVDDPWPTIAYQHDSSPSHYWHSHSHYTLQAIHHKQNEQNIEIQFNTTPSYMITQVLPWSFQARLILSQSFKLSWFESIGLVSNGFFSREKFLMELQTWVDFMELWTYLICSWVGSAICSFTKILRKEDMGTNFQRTWKEKFLSKEDIWEPICVELEKSFEQRRNGYPFVKNLRNSYPWQVRSIGATHKL
jgi:hypothetical protein